MTKSRGQITVLVLLLGLLGLTVSLSVASRSLSDLKQTTVVDSGTKALAAAEAGVQVGLNQLTQGASSDCIAKPLLGLSFSGIAGANDVTYTICPGNKVQYLTFNQVSSDDVIQIDLSKIQSSNTKGTDIIWSNSNVAIEAVTIDNSYSLARHAINGTGTNYSSFSPGNAASGCTNSYCSVDSTYNTGSCTSSNSTGNGFISLSNAYRLLRIKPLSGSASVTNITVCARSAGKSDMDIGFSGNTIIGTAKTIDGTVKRAQVTISSPALPAIFDNVIFSGGSLTK